MGMTTYRVTIKDVDNEILYTSDINHSSLVAYIILGLQLYKLRKNEKCPTSCSIERILLG